MRTDAEVWDERRLEALFCSAPWKHFVQGLCGLLYDAYETIKKEG